MGWGRIGGQQLFNGFGGHDPIALGDMTRRGTVGASGRVRDDVPTFLGCRFACLADGVIKAAWIALDFRAEAAMAASRPALTASLIKMTHRQPNNCAPQATDRPWLPSVAAVTVTRAQASAWIPSRRSWVVTSATPASAGTSSISSLATA